MATVWIGDFRFKQLQQYQEMTSAPADNIYLLEDAGEYSWFNTGLLEQLPQLALEKADVIISLGFNDCVYSCVWEKTFKINTIVDSYIKTIDELVDNYPDIDFYICSINPVDGDYSFAEYSAGIISKKDLLDKIASFNTKIKNSKATFIDTYGYLASTSFYTHDGVLFNEETLACIDSYINMSINRSGGTLFVPRLTAPVVDVEKSGEYWLGDSYGGVNPFDDLGQSYAKAEGDTLPNCTAYAWGRFYEILGERPTLSTGNAEDWYGNISDGYKRGNTPALGAIICWEGIGAAAGHVAIVEQINDDGSIVTSESGWNSSTYWWTTTRTDDNGNWGASEGYTFQGFIYNPKVADTGVIGDYIDKSQVTSGNFWLDLDGPEIKLNARYIWNYFGSKPEEDRWTLNAVAGMLGNMQTESHINPGIWQGLNEGKGPAYGLVQWDPFTKYTDWCAANGYEKSDIDSALKRIEAELQADSTGGALDQWGGPYDLTFKEFSKSTLPAYELGKAFLLNYERAADQSAAALDIRGKQAEKWYEFLLPYAPSATPTLILDNLKIDEYSPTKIKVSFITRGSKKGFYEVVGSSKKVVDKGELTITKNPVSFSCINLKPNTSYTLIVKLTGNSESDIIEETLTFSTPQDYPGSADNVVLTANDSSFPYNNFQLNVNTDLDWGYWKGNEQGYKIQLIVNGQVKKEKEVSFLPKTFKISDYFDYDNIKIGDTVQIGIRTWVAYDGEKLYDSDFANCSNPICMLKKPAIAYLNTD